MSLEPRTTELERDRSSEVRREMHLETERKPRLELSLPKILAGALAAASAAVAASWLGLAGTVMGAVVASVIVSVGSALYAHPIERSSQVIKQTLPLPSDRYRSSGSTDITETMVLDGGHDDVSETTSLPPVAAQAGIQPAAPKPARRIQWGTVVVSSVLTLVVGFGLLTSVESLLGHSLSGGDSGSTLSRIVERDSGGSSDTPAPAKPSQSTPTDDQPTQTEPTDPEPTDPDPTEPEPTEPEPTDPTTTEPTQPDQTGPSTGVDDGATEPVPSDDASTTLGATTL